MTVPSEVNRSGPYLGNGVTTVFSYGFKIVNQAHLRVIRTDAAGNETVLTLGANYSVAGVGNAGGGSITVSPAPASGQKITILRAMPFTQNLDLENQGAYYAEDVERAFDEAAMRDQELAEGLQRAVKVPSSTDDPDGTIADRLALGIIRLADSADNIDTVAENVDDVNTVSDAIANVNTVAGNIASVNTVADNIASVNTVAGIAANVNTVAGDHDEIVALAGITGNINTVASIAPAVTAVAGVADDIPTIADNITDVAAFGKIYLGPKTSDPTTRNNGTALMGGDLYFNTASKMLRVYDGTAWQAAAGQSLNMASQSFTGNGSATTFTLEMAPGVAANSLVWVGGVRQVPITDYTVSGSTLTFASAPGNGVPVDTLVIATVSTLYTPANGTVTPQSLAVGMGLTITTRAAVPSISIPIVVPAFRTIGYASAGDCGGAEYTRVASEPSHPGKVQSADGAWWEISARDVNLKQFGVKADGVTDDAPAFKDAAAYIKHRGGGRMLVPAGQIRVNSEVRITSSNTTLEGVNEGACWVINGTTGSPAVQFGDGVSVYSRNCITGILFGQAAGVTSVVGNCGLHATYQENFQMDRIQGFQFPGQLYDGIILTHVGAGNITNIAVQDSKNRNLLMRTECLDVRMSNGRFDAGKVGIEFIDVQGLHFVNVTAFGNTEHGYSMISGGGPIPNRYFYFNNVVGDTSGSHNWNIKQLQTALFTGCWGSTQLTQPPGNTASGFYFDGDGVQDVICAACYAITNNGHGFSILRARNIQLNGCQGGSDAFPETWGGQGAANGLGGFGNGVRIGENAKRVSVNGGHYNHNKGYGISIEAGAQNVQILGADVLGNTGGAILNLANATTAQAKIKDCMGYNPRGFITPPAMPASNAEVTNLTGSDCMVYIVGGTVSNVRISGQGVFSATPCSILVAAGEKVSITYTVAPAWQWRIN